MAAKFQQGLFKMSNPTRYIGKHIPRYRSGWELKFMRFCDTHPSVVAWASESHRIPYFNPIKNKQTHYVPDFFIIYEDKHKKRHAEFIEIKPASQMLGNAKSTAQKAQAIVNEAKWQAAKTFAQKQGVGFRVLTENELFNHSQSPKKKR
jgi:NADH dehydrogenase/NADH:ubiquinone oxidoreductase subunit G